MVSSVGNVKRIPIAPNRRRTPKACGFSSSVFASRLGVASRDNGRVTGGTVHATDGLVRHEIEVSIICPRISESEAWVDRVWRQCRHFSRSNRDSSNKRIYTGAVANINIIRIAHQAGWIKETRLRTETIPVCG